MKPFLALLKVTFRNYFGISVMKQKYLVEKKDLWQPIAAVVGIGFILVFFFSMSMMFSKGLYYVGQMLGEPALVLVISFITTAFIIFIFDIGTVISVFYFGRDNELLAALPLKPLLCTGCQVFTGYVQPVSGPARFDPTPFVHLLPGGRTGSSVYLPGICYIPGFPRAAPGSGSCIIHSYNE